MVQYIWVAVSALSAVAGLFFLRFWRDTRERLFAVLAAAFWVLSLNYLCLLIIEPVPESRHWVYLLRLSAFLLIIGGIVDKNLRPRT